MQPNFDLLRAKELIKKCKVIHAYTMLSPEEGSYVRVYKYDLLDLLNNGADFDLQKFDLRKDGTLYIN